VVTVEKICGCKYIIRKEWILYREAGIQTVLEGGEERVCKCCLFTSKHSV